jgi:hypothetical protein
MRRLAPLLCASLLVGCADNQETLIVLMAPAWGMEGECIVDPGAEDALLFGVVDLALKSRYLMPAVLLNNSGEQPVNDNNTGVISNEIQLKSAEITLDSEQEPKLFDGLGSNLTHFSVSLATNSIAPGQTVGVAVEVIPQATANELAERFAGHEVGARVTIRANVKFIGTRSGNDVGKIGRVEARDFSFPIELCENCLLYCGGCENPEGCMVTAGSFAGGVCGNAQDLPVWPLGCEGPTM